MSEAKVKSLEAIETFLEAIQSLREDTRKQVDDIQEQIQRVSTWLDKEMPDYWRNEFRKAERKWSEAREELLQCQAKTRSEDETSCFLERKQLARATERRNLCEQKVRQTAQLAREWAQMQIPMTTHVRQLDDLSESNLMLAITRLQSTIDTLKRYMAS